MAAEKILIISSEQGLVKLVRQAMGGTFEVVRAARDLNDGRDFAGHVMLKSASSASFLNSNAPDISVPEEIIRKLEGLSREELLAASQQITVEFIKKAKSLCQGVHLVPMGWERFIPTIAETVAG